MRKWVHLLFLLFILPAFADETKLSIRTSAGVVHHFTIEVANSSDQKARGLMFRQTLDEDKGMIFNNGPLESEAAMWMKNTFIPLDMLFIKKDGTIHRIAENTTPFSLETVESKGQVMAVLELKGGVTAKLNIKAGDKVTHEIFK